MGVENRNITFDLHSGQRVDALWSKLQDVVTPSILTFSYSHTTLALWDLVILPNRALECFLFKQVPSPVMVFSPLACFSVFFFFFLTVSVDLNRINWAQLTHRKLTNHEAITEASRECLFWMNHMSIHPLSASMVKTGTNRASQNAALRLTFLASPLHKSIRSWGVGGRLLSSRTSLDHI